jgi:serine/threonine-protein kinase
MIGSFGEVLVLDWGVAKIRDNPCESVGTVVGTRDYMSPEQARGEIDQIGQRTDVYSLGAVLRFLLADKATKPAKAICLKAMSNEPESRYASATELSADIGRLLDAEPVLAYRENAVERVSRWVGKNRFLVLLVLAYLLMRIILIFTSRT